MPKELTKDEIRKMVQQEDVKFIRLQFVDIMGVIKNVAITEDQLEKALSNEIIFDGSSIAGFVRDEESDMYLRPDLSTFCIFPWRPHQGKVARLICDIYKTDGTPFAGDPRGALKRVVEEASEMGFKMHLGPEYEFFLFHTDENGHPTTKTHDQAGYFDLGPVDLGENVRRDIVLMLEEMGFEIQASHHEDAPGQHEIDFQSSSILKAADDMITFKLVVKVVAQKHGLHATFMPKPIFGINGSGMHCNMTMLDLKGKNVFYDPQDKNKLSHTAYYFMGGLLKHIKAITALTNPTVNSYKRLVPGYEAPTLIGWSTTSASPLIRIPSTNNEQPVIELRSPDPSCNPYLAATVILKAGLDGIKNKIAPPEMNIPGELIRPMDHVDFDAHLPSNLKEAMLELAKDDVIKEALGEIYESLSKAKMIEWQEYSSKVHDWEIDKYISRY